MLIRTVVEIASEKSWNKVFHCFSQTVSVFLSWNQSKKDSRLSFIVRHQECIVPSVISWRNSSLRIRQWKATFVETCLRSQSHQTRTWTIRQILWTNQTCPRLRSRPHRLSCRVDWILSTTRCIGVSMTDCKHMRRKYFPRNLKDLNVQLSNYFSLDYKLESYYSTEFTGQDLCMKVKLIFHVYANISSCTVSTL